MRRDDPLDSFEEALLRAARRERTRTGALERTANALVASHRRRRARPLALVLGGALALAAGAALVLRSGPSAQSIQAEQLVPRHSVSSVAVGPSVPEQSEPAEPNFAASDEAAALRSGLASTTLEEEIVMLDGARSELGSGKPESALTLLDEYDRVSGAH
jgi:hypothetical protein